MDQCQSKMIKIMNASLSKLHDHLADGLPVVDLLMSLVYRHTNRPGAGKAGGGQASSGQTLLVRVSWRKKSEKCTMRHAYWTNKIWFCFVKWWYLEWETLDCCSIHRWTCRILMSRTLMASNLVLRILLLDFDIIDFFLSLTTMMHFCFPKAWLPLTVEPSWFYIFFRFLQTCHCFF